MGRIHLVEGIMCGPDYVKILQESYLGTLRDFKMRVSGPSAPIFQQDNDPKHRSKVAEEFFKKKRVPRLAWPPSSPDLNIIEQVWDQLDRLVRAREALPRNRNELWDALQEEWLNISQDSIDRLFESMPRRVQAVIEARGGNTRY